MSKNITQQNQKNLWGRQVDGAASRVLEPQRVDLFLVDLEQAAKAISNVIGESMPFMIPQFVRSVSFPEVKVRTEPYRRDSIPFNMPSWDEPVDGVKIVFLMDTYDGNNQSNVCDLLDMWVALTRAGRGSRNGGYRNNTGWFTLDASYKVACQFDINISLLRGAVTSQAQLQAASDAAALNNVNAALYNSYVQDYERQQAAAAAGEEPDYVLNAPGPEPATVSSTLPFTDMVEHTKWVLRQAWCAGYKLADLNYTEAGLATVEATFYPETIERETIGLSVTGNLKSVSGGTVGTK